MSHTILYNRQFIKIDEEHVIPMIEVGDNNVYDMYNKRARDWQCGSLNFVDDIVANNEELLAVIDKEDKRLSMTTDYDPKNFGSRIGIRLYGKQYGSFQQYKNFWVLGIKQAMTIEELLVHGISFDVTLSYYKITELAEKGIHDIGRVCNIKTTDELINAVNDLASIHGVHHVKININGVHNLKSIKKLRRKDKHRVKVDKKLDHFFVLNSQLGFLCRKLKRGYQYTSYFGESVKVFETEKQAQGYLKKYPTLARDFEPQRMNHEITIQV